VASAFHNVFYFQSSRIHVVEDIKVVLCASSIGSHEEQARPNIDHVNSIS